MDRRASRALVAFAGLALIGASPTDAPLRELRWLSTGADRVTALTTRPDSCLPTAARADPQVQVGLAAFSDPLLLGGQAARAGLSCESCHRNGRNNPDFVFPGVSGPPGTADVTSSLFSRKRGDGLFNPKPIPDLGGAKDRLKIDQATPALEAFLHGLIVEEFDGAEPPAAVIGGLAAYVRALSPEACGPRRTGLRVAELAAEAQGALGAADHALAGGDTPLALVMIRAARARLARIAERYPASAFAEEPVGLRAMDARLIATLEAARLNRPDVRDMLKAVSVDLQRLSDRLQRGEDRSLFARPVIRRSLQEEARRPPPPH